MKALRDGLGALPLERIAELLVAGKPEQAIVDEIVWCGHEAKEAREAIASLKQHALYGVARRTQGRMAKMAGLLRLTSRLRARSERAKAIPQCSNLSVEEFLESYYYASCPVVIRSYAADWNALTSWSPKALAERWGELMVEYVDDECRKFATPEELRGATRQIALRDFVQLVERTPVSNAFYIVAANFSLLRPPLCALLDDVRPPLVLEEEKEWWKFVRLWFGPRGTITALHHDLTPGFLVQIYGAKRVRLYNALDLPDIPNPHAVYSSEDPMISEVMESLPVYDVTLEPSDLLFIPAGWWHWVYALSTSISVGFTGFGVRGAYDNWENGVL